MARVWRQTRPIRMRDDVDYVDDTAVVDDPVDRGSSIIARIIDVIGGFIIAVLALRFLLVLFGANAANGFASFIYSVSNPFVRPFFGLFGAEPQFNGARFEYESLIAIAVYAILTVLLARLVSIPRRSDY